ncbi:MAG TPA: purine permease [Deltaproteobacteria bacterium]|nr:purine permease [Deltaproteobacteria bacterium]
MPPHVGLDAPLHPLTALAYGLQHVLAMAAGLVAPPLVVAHALGLPPDQRTLLVAMALLTSGLTTWLQVWRMGPVGSGLLLIQGTSFTFVPVAVQAGSAGGLALIFGSALATAPVELVASRLLRPLRRRFPPVVTGSVVLLIGLDLIRIGIGDLAGGVGIVDPGAPRHLIPGLLVMALVVVFSQAPGSIRAGAVGLALAVGYIGMLAMGRIELAAVAGAPWVALPHPLASGLEVRPDFLIPFAIAYLVSAVETLGDLTAASEASDQPVEGPIFIARAQGGLLADGLGSALAALLGCLPNTTFSQNIGVISLTGVASRRVGLAAAGLLVGLGLCPKLAAVISATPRPVLGGATTVLFATVAVGGLKIALRDGMGPRNQLILAVTLGLGLGVSLEPGTLTGWTPQGVLATSLHTVLGSGVAVGAIVATALEAGLPRGR